MLEILYPEFAGRDCQHCQKYLYDDERGFAIRQEGTDRLVQRAPTNLPRCRQVSEQNPDGRCPKGTPENQRDLSEQNRRAYRFHLRCKTIGRFPRDSRVEKNAELIAAAVEVAERRKQWIAENLLRMRLDLIHHDLEQAIRLRLL